MKSWEKWAITGAVAGALTLLAAEAWAHWRSKPACNVPSQLLQGHRYKVTIVDPTATQAAPSDVTQYQTVLDQTFPGKLKVVAADPLGTTSVTLIVDVVGPTIDETGICAKMMPNAPAGTTVDVSDMGLTPAGG